MGGAGFATSHGAISDLQSNPTPGDNSKNYGQSDATLEAKDSTRGTRDAAQAPGNPSDSR
jgi:hypothetical protein